MTSSPRRRRANRANALRSTGPRTALGKRAASLNATRHGLSTHTDPDALGPTAQGVADLVALDGIAPAKARELAARIVDFERNLSLQRALLLPGPQPEPDLARMHRETPELDMLQEALDWELHTTGRVPKRRLKGFATQAARLQASWLRRQPKPARANPAAYDRYLRRAANQLTRALRSLRPP